MTGNEGIQDWLKEHLRKKIRHRERLQHHLKRTREVKAAIERITTIVLNYEKVAASLYVSQSGCPGLAGYPENIFGYASAPLRRVKSPGTSFHATFKARCLGKNLQTTLKPMADRSQGK